MEFGRGKLSMTLHREISTSEIDNCVLQHLVQYRLLKGKQCICSVLRQPQLITVPATHTHIPLIPLRFAYSKYLEAGLAPSLTDDQRMGAVELLLTLKHVDVRVPAGQEFVLTTGCQHTKKNYSSPRHVISVTSLLTICVLFFCMSIPKKHTIWCHKGIYF